MVSSGLLLVFAAAFVGCILATPAVTRLARWAGAIDRPDQFRRIHKGAIPRLGGLGVATGLAVAGVAAWFGVAGAWGGDRALEQAAAVAGCALVLALGVRDDTRGVNPRTKLLGQTAAVLVLVAGGIRITRFSLLGVPFNMSYPLEFLLGGQAVVFDPPSTLVTLLWFLACMNIWNLIDGMDGLASGVGLLVSGTLMLVALREGNSLDSARMAAALAGSLAAFLLYNWHPACIFLGDSGSLLIGMLIGLIGVQSSMKGTTTVSILFPILAMGLPISDTAMAIFRRWVRDLPLSSADRRHIHHLLIGLGLNPRQAAAMLYCFSGFLCGVVLLGVTLSNKVHGEFFALIVGASGCLAFLLILTSRRDELKCLLADLRDRRERKGQDRAAAKLTWESIQKIELCEDLERIWDVLETAGRAFGCAELGLACHCGGRSLLQRRSGPPARDEVSASTARFRLQCADDLRLTLSAGLSADSAVASDIAFRSLQRLALAASQRLERLAEASDDAAGDEPPVIPRVIRPAESVGARLQAEPAVSAVARWEPRLLWLRRIAWSAVAQGRAG